jgi:hypothetical protein
MNPTDSTRQPKEPHMHRFPNRWDLIALLTVCVVMVVPSLPIR